MKLKQSTRWSIILNIMVSVIMWILHNHSCTCWHFDLDHISCSHAIAACRYTHMSCYPLCSKYYTVNSLLSSYAESIYPPRHQTYWMIPDDIGSRVVLPSKTRRPTGRPRKERIPSGGEGKRRRRCGWCGDYGHNQKSCKWPLPLHYQNDNSGHIEIGMQDYSLQSENEWNYH